MTPSPTPIRPLCDEIKWVFKNIRLYLGLKIISGLLELSMHPLRGQEPQDTHRHRPCENLQHWLVQLSHTHPGQFVNLRRVPLQPPLHDQVHPLLHQPSAHNLGLVAGGSILQEPITPVGPVDEEQVVHQLVQGPHGDPILQEEAHPNPKSNINK